MTRAITLFISVALSLALGACGTDTNPGGNGAGISCGVGETVALDSQGNKFCQKAGDAGTIGGTDGGSSGGADASGGTSGGGTSGGGDAGGSSGGTSGAGSDGGATDTGGPSDPWLSCPPVKGTGAEHGKKCTKHEDCLYGYCMKGGFLTGYDDSISYCTKNNACTGGGSKDSAPCSVDDGVPSGVSYKSAFEKSKSSGNDKRTSGSPYKVCARTCKSDADCQAWNPELPDCIKNSTKYVSFGTQSICGKNPLK